MKSEPAMMRKPGRPSEPDRKRKPLS